MNKLYKLKNTLYQDDFYNTVSNEAVYEYDSVKKKEILTTPLWARKGELFYVIKVTKENFDELDDEYGLSYDDNKKDIKLVIVHKAGHKWFFSYNDECEYIEKEEYK